MKNMKNLIALLLAAGITVTSFSACKMQPAQEPTVTPTPEVTQTGEVTQSGHDAQLSDLKYNGSGSDYVYSMTDERDRAREEDIVFFADKYLDKENGHPKIVDIDCTITVYNSLKTPDTTTVKLYDEALRNEFIRRINELIESIPERSDDEIFLGLAETAAILNDSEGAITGYLDDEDTFSFYTTPIVSENGFECYITRIAKDDEKYLMCRIDAINGIKIDEVFSRLGKLIGHASENDLIHTVCISAYISACNDLRYLGIMDEGNTATFTLTDRDGKTFDAEFESMLVWDSMKLDMVSYSSGTGAEESEIGTWFKSSHDDYWSNPWYEFLSNGKALYVRPYRGINWMVDTDYLKEMEKEAKKAGTVEKLIVDCRGLEGGDIENIALIIASLNKIKASEGKYVLIDHTSSRISVAIASLIKRFVDGAELVGSPAGKAPLSIHSATLYDLPNLGSMFFFSINEGDDYWPGYENEVLMPDTTIYQTAEDYKNGVDSVLKALLD